jgi:hypothetical protein
MADPEKSRHRARQQPARPVPGDFIMIMIQVSIIPARALDISWWMRPLGRRVAGHCLSVSALMVRWIAAKAWPVER